MPLTHAQFIGFLNATRTVDVIGDPVQTARQRNAAILKWALGLKKDRADMDDMRWRIALQERCDLRGRVPYQQDSPGTQPPVEHASSRFVHLQDESITHDFFVARKLANTKGKLFDTRKQDARSRMKAVVERVDQQMLGTPDSENDEANFKGLLYHFAYSRASDGSFVEDTDGGFNGQYIELGNGGGYTAVWNNLNTSLAKNRRARNWCQTRLSLQMTEEVLGQVLHACLETQYEAIPMLDDKPMGMPNVIFSNYNDREAIIKNLDRRGEQQGAEIYGRLRATIAGVNVQQVEQLRHRPECPLFGVRSDAFTLYRDEEYWFKVESGEVPMTAGNVVYEPLHVIGQLNAENRGDIGWVLHGDWS